MSKLSFRARALDPSKSMPILRSDDVPDLPDFAIINRAVPQIPTGMEKEEESEHHLQMAISAQQSFGLRTNDHVIPTPEVFGLSEVDYNTLYPTNFKMPRQMIHVQLPAFEDELPDYDLDEEDRRWFLQMQEVLGIDELKFEEMIECLEKNSGVYKVLDISEARALLKLDESVVISVYDYWLQKKLNCGKSLLPQIKTEKRDGTSGNNPYIAFRRRTEKMQTRKNRKNDEASYEKMLKLKRDFVTVRELMEKIQQREKQKLDVCRCHRDIYEKRYKLEDFDSRILTEILDLRAKEQNTNNNLPTKADKHKVKNDENLARKKRDYKKKKTETQVPPAADAASSDDENGQSGIVFNGQAVQKEVDDHPDGRFAFKRKKGCHYYAPLNESPWGNDDGRLDSKYKFSLVSLSRPRNHSIGFARRRVGRGGRIIFDRTEFSDANSDYFYPNRSMVFGPESDEEDERETWFEQRKLYQNSGDFSDNEYADNSNIKIQDCVETNIHSFHEKRLALNKQKQLLERLESKEYMPIKNTNNPNILEMKLPKTFLDDIQANINERLSQRSTENASPVEKTTVLTAVDNVTIKTEENAINNHVSCDKVQAFTPTNDDLLTNNDPPMNNGDSNNKNDDETTNNTATAIKNEFNDSNLSTKTFITCKVKPVSNNQNSTNQQPTDVT